jgi:hypothetical protein
MAVINKTPSYRIDGRVSIALDALDDKQKQAVSGVIADRDKFLASTTDGRNVRKISQNDPFYVLRVPTGLRIIYSKVGDDIVVMDLMRKATLDRYGPRKLAKTRKSGSKTFPADFNPTDRVLKD